MHNEDQKVGQGSEGVLGATRKPMYHGGLKERKGKVFPAKTLEQMRTDLDLTVEDFARLLGLSFMAVYNWERGGGMVEVSDLQSRILTALNHMTVAHPDLYWADDVGKAVVNQGGLYGLHKLLTHYYRSLAQQQAQRRAAQAQAALADAP